MKTADLLSKVDARQRKGMEYFIQHHDQMDMKYEGKHEGVTLYSPALGIYKPSYSEYVLSVKETLKGHYPDQPIFIMPDGKRFYLYHQQGEVGEHLTLNANIALNKNMKDKIPVGVAIQKNAKGRGGSSYNTYSALVIGWVEGFYILYFADENGEFDLDVYNLSSLDIFNLIMDAGQHERLENEDEFSPKDIVDARKKILRSIILRQGQPKFRKDLLNAYDEKCVISDCGIMEVLEASHITPYLGKETNVVSNGLLLRCDLHTLWDKFLISIIPETMQLDIHPSLSRSEYAEFDGKYIRFPYGKVEELSKEALQMHYDIFTKNK